jgi:hypothetical protein
VGDDASFSRTRLGTEIEKCPNHGPPHFNKGKIAFRTNKADSSGVKIKSKNAEVIPFWGVDGKFNP